jgi:OmpA-OmpF porin, OOP family
MKLHSAVLACTAVLALCGSALADGATGWYVGIGAGWDKLNQVSIHNGSSSEAYKSKDAVLYDGFIGYKFENGFRIENEVNYDIHNFTVGYDVSSTDREYIKGHSSTTSDFFNVLYDIPLSENWNFHIGAGAGFGNNSTHLYSTYNGATVTGQRFGFQWQGIAGLEVVVNSQVNLFVDYHFRSLMVDKDLVSYTTTTTTGGLSTADLNEHVVMFGLRYFLNPAAPPAPPPPPPAPKVVAAPPPPPPPVTTYIVFFDFNKANLTDKAQEVVAEAVKTAKTNGFVKVQVVGHTDTVGTDKYNQTLSIARAQSVKDEMVRLGLGADGIAIEGKSFHDPLVATGPGVREPQNRRAVIDLGK